MQLKGLLHRTFKKKSTKLHRYTFDNLMNASSTLIQTNKLNLTDLGRNFSKENTPRSDIKKVDRLLSNPALQQESSSFYQTMINLFSPANILPWTIHVDWSCICSQTKLYFLRASLSMSGRSFVLYEEVHPKKKENNHAVHKKFLNHLKTLLPPSSKPIIVTDAGFRAPWFSYILKIGWDFVGRVRNKNKIKLASSKEWQLSGSLYDKATSVPTDLGEGILTESEKVQVRFILYKGKKKKRHKLNKVNRKISQAGKSKRYSKSHVEPWLLVTSLPHTDKTALKTVNIYRQRMRIEENIRDTKSTRYGFSLNESRTHIIKRMKILLLIAAIATFACWIAGLIIKDQGKAPGFQTRSTNAKFSLSIVFLGRVALKKGLMLTKKHLRQGIELLIQNMQYTHAEVYSWA
jgi:hypothetical protein